MYLASKPAIEVRGVSREQCLPPCLEAEPLFLEWTLLLLLLSVFVSLSSPGPKSDCCDSCAFLVPSISSSNEGKLSSSSSPPPLLRLPLRSSRFEGTGAVGIKVMVKWCRCCSTNSIKELMSRRTRACAVLELLKATARPYLFGHAKTRK